MRYKKILIITFIFLNLAFNIPKANSQTIDSPALEEIKTKALCLLGEKVKKFPFYVYKDAESGENNFSPTGDMGDFSNFKIDTYCRESPYSGISCIKIIYEAKLNPANGWAGLYWQYPPNNWGNIPKSYDLSEAKKVTFWAKGKDGKEVINKFQVGGISGEYRDSGVVSIGPIALSKKWKKYTINLKKMTNFIIVGNENKECWPFMKPLSRVIGGFAWATSLEANNNNSITFYLDEIRFEK